MNTNYTKLICGLGLLGMGTSASAQSHVLSLQNSSMQPYTCYSYEVVPTDNTTWLTVLFREDPAFWGFDQVALTDTNGINVMVNGSFETGNLTGWMTVGQQGLEYSGYVASSSSSPAETLSLDTSNPKDGNYYWVDGAVGGVDGVAQAIPTIAGNTYTLSFWLAGDGTPDGSSSFDAFIGAQVSTFNGNVILYNGEPVVPEPSTLALATLGGLGMLWRFRRRH
jgi:hypothetical protein